MSKLRALLLVGAFAGCATDDPMVGDDTPVNPDDVPPFTSGVSMLSGHAEPGYVDGKRGNARFKNPVSCAYRDGNVYVADFDNGKIRVVDAETGFTSTVISQQNFQKPFGMVFAPDGTLYVSTDKSPDLQQGITTGTIWRVDVDAQQAEPIAVGIGRPRGLAFLNGKLYATDYQNHVVSMIDPVSGAVTPLAGTWQVAGMADAAGAAAKFNEPYGLVAKDGKLIVADFSNHRIREVSLDGSVRTLAGVGTAGYGDGAMAAAKFSRPQGMAVTSTGELYVSDIENFRLRKIQGDVTTLSGSGKGGYLDNDDLLAAEFFGLEGICVNPDGSYLYVADGTRGEERPYHRIRSVKLK